jgi:hypothetical protein
VDDEKPQRRFQFSLRKLMLWMVVVAMYASFMRLYQLSLIPALILTGWLFATLAIRVLCGFVKGCVFAIGFGVVASVAINANDIANEVWPGGMEAVLFLGMAIVVSAVAGLCGFFVVDLVVRLVESVERLFEPKSTASRKRSQQPDATSTEE